jgi:hypothetical protein
MLGALRTNPMLQELSNHEVLFLTITSSMFQNLTGKVAAIIEGNHKNNKELKFIYLSDNKVRAMEDCTTFSPHIFKLTKSYIVTEPVTSFQDFIQQRSGGGAHKVPRAGYGQYDMRAADAGN